MSPTDTVKTRWTIVAIILVVLIGPILYVFVGFTADKVVDKSELHSP